MNELVLNPFNKAAWHPAQINATIMIILCIMVMMITKVSTQKEKYWIILEFFPT